MTRLLTALCAILLVAGCGGGSGYGDGDQATDQAETAQQEAHEAANEAGSAALVAPASYEGAETMTLTGDLGCGHCSHQMGTSCSAALQTADGTVYILDGMGAGDMPFDKRFDGLKLKVVGAVAQNQGTNFVKVDSVEQI